jgi:hypothetical protein
MYSVIVFFVPSSPGVVVTELQKRGGLDEEAYIKVNTM